MVWLPRTAVGDGDDPGTDGEAEAVGLADEAGDVDGDPDRVADGEVVAVAAGSEAGAVADADALCPTVGALSATVGEGTAATREELGPVPVAGGLSAIDPVDDAAKTTAPSATSPASTAIGTRPIRPLTGRTSRQLGQNPDTGVAT